MPQCATNLFWIAAISCGLLSACGARTGLRVGDASTPSDVPDIIDVVSPPPRTYLGTEFWAVSTSNSYLPRTVPFSFAVALGNPNPDPVNITISGQGLTSPMRFSIPAGGTTTRALPWIQALAQQIPGSGVCRPPDFSPIDLQSARAPGGAYRIQSSAPINAYQFNPLQFRVELGSCVQYSYTNDASLLLPTAALGTNYRVLTYRDRESFFAVVGTSATPTRVRVQKFANYQVRGGATPDESGPNEDVYVLGQGEVLQLVGRGELTGTGIVASAPVAVFAGSNCTFVSWPNDSEFACDHLEEQLFPEDTWGREAIVTSFQDRGPNEGTVVRVLAGAMPAELTFVPPTVHAPARVAPGTTLDFETREDVLIRSSTPVLVAQFMEGQETTPGFEVGDPAMLLSVPTAQYRQDYSFTVPSTYTQSFVYATARSGAIVLLDRRRIMGTPTTIPGTDWQVYRELVVPGAHLLTTTHPEGVGLVVLGVAAYTSYAYPGGLDLRSLR